MGESWKNKIMEGLIAVLKSLIFVCRKTSKHKRVTGCHVNGGFKGSMAEAKSTC